MDIQSYLDQVFKKSFLSRRERSDLAEEMTAHLHSSKEHHMNEGCTEEQATTKAIASFGDPISIRTKLTQETYGLSSKLILQFITISLILYLSSLFTGVALHYYDVHNRVIELFPIAFITLCALSSALLLTRKNIDRWCLLSVPILFGLGYLQAYLGLFKNMFGGLDSFTLFENLFFSGAYDFSGRSSFMLIGGLILAVQTLILFVISKNIYISLMPFAFSILYTVSHMVIFGSYYLFFGDHFSSSVTNGYNVFAAGNIQRLSDIGVKLVMCLVLFFTLSSLKKLIFKSKLQAG
ncbi:permease prefix domain 1-containing protein [Paenibacillus silvae]|uniref:permease prefix domain 1-containing protein n=1 Tax=Paenibacillus silvae TaxID=1325358 RepID=UPI002006D61C|nr:permease prefix domain 1-containing protein [Paenibacillus silvae]MCK6077074.1 permease prefix domain 1-containing protein [Paenibacillus silvae]MCK6151272.1 permease prefix domain 1-containing protein [Paenibacillus silvae]MCK6269760.1 permease prefix domain 1-containing protein [Paenibacillus silvae]